ITLEQGDALNLKFPDDSFDYVMAFHVVSVVPDPNRMMTEARRVCRPGGTITIVNHFRSPKPAIARLQRTIDPITRWLGWTTLHLGDVLDHRTLHVERQWKTSPRSLFTIVVARNAKALLAAEELLRADLREHAHELRKASRELLEQAGQGGARRLRRQARVGVAAERSVVLGSHQAPLEAVDEHARDEQRGIGDALQLRV